jgi:hypothetical protein
MKRIVLIVCMVGLMAFLGAPTLYAQPMGPGMMGPGGGWGGNWNYCPYCGNYTGPGYGMGPWMMGRGYGYGYGMGPGMMGGYGMGPGMMGPGYGMGPGMMGPGYGRQYSPQFGPQYEGPQKPLDKEQVKQQVENYLKSTRNPNLKIGKIEEKGNDYEVDIETQGGSLVDRLVVNKDTGWMRSAY